MKAAMRTIGAALGIVLLAAGAAPAQLTQPSSVADGMGAWSAGGDWVHVSAGGQPGGIAVATFADRLNSAGFLGCAVLRPDLDGDGDGLADEIDPDNDGDGLWDIPEVTGAAFWPATPTDVNNPDTDGDGVTDLAEAGAQTDPLDDAVYLHFTRIERDAGGDVELDWQARENYLYQLYRLDPTNGLPGVYVADVRAPAGGVGPWAVVTASNTVAGSSDRQTFYLQVVGP